MLNIDSLSALIYSTAVLGGLLVGSISPTIIISRSATLGITLLHSVLAGSLLGVYVSDVLMIPVPPVITASVVAIAFSILTAEAVERGLSEDTAISISVSVSTTLTIILTYYISSISSLGVSKAMGYVFGTSALVTFTDVTRLATAIIVVLPLGHLFWGEFKYIAFDPEGAYAMGLSVRFYRYLFYTLVAITATTLSMSIGVLLTHIIIALPGMVALSLGTRRYHLISYPTGVALMLLGYLLAKHLTIPPSGGVGILSVILIAIIMVRRKWSPT